MDKLYPGICSLIVFTLFVQIALGENDRPVIGILAQQSSSHLQPYGDTFIAGTYVSYVQAAGARAVPIRVEENDDYYETIFGGLNGILFPGGGVDIVGSDYAKAAGKLFKLALKANDNGDFFPVWGTCLGFELLTALVSKQNDVVNCECEDQQLPLNMTVGFEKSRLFGGLPKDILHSITSLPITPNYHHECLTPAAYNSRTSLTSFYKVLSTNMDQNGVEFISSIEAYKYPVYGVQWHPEKNIYTWNTNYTLNHGREAVRMAQYFADFLVNEARKSNHTFPNEEFVSELMFYNYKLWFAGAPSFDYYYFFNYTTTEDDQDTNIFGLPSNNYWKYEYFRALGDLQFLLLVMAAGLGCLSFFVLARRWMELQKQKAYLQAGYLKNGGHTV